MDVDGVLDLLQNGSMQPHGMLPWSSNYNLLVTLCHQGTSALAIYKPRRGERPLWDFPDGTLCQREVSAYIVDRCLGWNLVPPTVLRRGVQGVGAVQLYIANDPEQHFFTFRNEFTGTIQRIAIFDAVINNGDRKAGHILRDASDHLWCIDHGVAFSVEPKLRTVIWDYAGDPIPAALLEDLRRLLAEVEQPWQAGPVSEEIHSLLDEGEIGALKRRIELLLKRHVFPRPASGHYIPWPPV
ncbi:MAG: SCO1664 family protein [Chloroflexi bacterium]|nr:SCO1664 family protein [Chloroflexota bacterium]